MRFGPHTAAVEEFLVALQDPAVRRLRGRPVPTDVAFRNGAAVFERVSLARRFPVWNDARMTAARVAPPGQGSAAAAVALALAASDLIDDLWNSFTTGPLGRVVERPGGPLAERCTCGTQTGERLLRELANHTPHADPRVPSGPDCGHTVPALPSPDALAVAFGLVHRWDAPDWDRLLVLARRLAR